MLAQRTRARRRATIGGTGEESKRGWCEAARGHWQPRSHGWGAAPLSRHGRDGHLQPAMAGDPLESARDSGFLARRLDSVPRVQSIAAAS